jgi:RNA polymerase sigma factor (sigma-70 family)
MNPPPTIKVNNGAMLRLYIQHFKRVARMAAEITGDHQSGEDIAQESFLRVYNKEITNMDHAEGCWVIAAKNGALNYRQRNRIVLKDPVIERYEEFRELYDDIILKRVYELLEALPDQRRKIFNMVHFEDMSCAQVARTLNLSESTVRVQYKRCVDYFKKNIKVKERYDKPI